MAPRTTPLHPIQRAQGAVFGAWQGWELAARFGALAEEVRAAQEGAALVDWGHHALTRVRGADRQPFLNRLVSNKVELAPGQGVHAFLLSTSGKPILELWILERGEELWIQAPQTLQETLIGELDRYHFREDLSFHDASGELAGLAVLGPRTWEVLAQLHGEELEVPALHGAVELDLEGVPAVACRTRQAGVEGAVLWVPWSRAAAAWQTALGAEPAPVPVGMEALAALQVEAGIPVHGIDYTPDTLFLEMAPADSYSEEKGCYIGQEVVARVLHRGRVNRRLTRLAVRGGGEAPEPGARLTAEGKEVGWITRGVDSPSRGLLALGYVRREHLEAGSLLSLPDGRQAEVLGLPAAPSP